MLFDLYFLQPLVIEVQEYLQRFIPGGRAFFVTLQPALSTYQRIIRRALILKSSSLFCPDHRLHLIHLIASAFPFVEFMFVKHVMSPNLILLSCNCLTRGLFAFIVQIVLSSYRAQTRKAWADSLNNPLELYHKYKNTKVICDLVESCEDLYVLQVQLRMMDLWDTAMELGPHTFDAVAEGLPDKSHTRYMVLPCLVTETFKKINSTLRNSRNIRWKESR